MKQQKFEDLMQRYHGQMENALYAVEQQCLQYLRGGPCYHPTCPFNNKTSLGRLCGVITLRAILGDHVPQHDIEIPEDDTQAQRKRERSHPVPEENPCVCCSFNDNPEIIKKVKEHHANIRKEERERVIKLVEEHIKDSQHKEDYFGSYCVYSDRFDYLFESLRKGAP